MKAYIKRVLKEKVKRSNLKKQELKTKILKKFIQDNKLAKTSKYYISSTLFLQKRKASHGRQKLVCFLSGRRRGVWRFIGLSRHAINKLNLEARIPAASTKSW